MSVVGIVTLAVVLGQFGPGTASSPTPPAYQLAQAGRTAEELEMARQLQRYQKKLEKNLDLMSADLPAKDWVKKLDDPQPYVRVAAIAGLVRLEDRRAVVPLARELTAHVARLGEAKPDRKTAEVQVSEALDAMSSVFLNIHVPQLLIGAVNAMPDPSYIPPLEQWLAKDLQNEEIRDALAACRRLGPQGGSGPAAVVAPPSGALDALTLDDPELKRDRLYEALTVAGPDALLRALERSMAAGPNELKPTILREIFRRPEQELAGPAAQWTASTVPQKRVVVATALGRFMDVTPAPEAILSILRQLAEDADAQVAVAGIDALHMRTLADRDNLRSLRSATHPDASVRAKYVWALYGGPHVADWLQSHQDIEALVRFLRDPSPEVRSHASDSIEMIQSFEGFRHEVKLPEVRAAVSANATDETAPLALRGKSMTILANLREASVVPMIAAALENVDRLSGDGLGDLHDVLQAAEAMPDRSYVAALVRYKNKLAELDADVGSVDELIARSRKARRR